MQSKKSHYYIQLFLLIVFPFLSFFQTLDHEFVWDDDVHIIHNDYDKPEKSKNILKYWSPNPKLIYAPLTYTFWGYLKNGHGGKLNPEIFHLVNIIIHILNGCLIFHILKRLLHSGWPAFAGAMLFALHPIQVEAVAWATGLRTLLSAFMGFSAILFYLLFREKNSNKLLYSCSLFLFFLSLTAKPSAVILPAFLFLIDYFHYKNEWKTILIRLIPYILVAFIFAWILIITNTRPKYVTSFWNLPLIMADTFNFYLYKFFIPIKLCSYYGRTPLYIMKSSWFYLSWIIPLIFTWGMIRIKNIYPVIPFAALLFITGILPVSGIIPFEAQNWNTPADRYLYYSMLGAALCFAYLLDKWQGKKTITILAFIILAFCFVRSSLVQVPQWKNDLSIWNSAITYFPNQSIPYSKRGEIYMEQGKLEQAYSDYRQSVTLDPGFAKGYNNIGLIYSYKGEWNKALQAYLQAVRLDPGLARTYKNIGLIFTIQKKYDKAEEVLRKAIKTDPGYADAYYQLSRVYHRQKKYEESETALKETIRLNTKHIKAYIALANLYADMNLTEKTFESWQMVLILDPDNLQALKFFHSYKP